LKKIRKYLITGILTLLPLIITIYVTKFVFEFIDGILEPLIVLKFGRQIPGIGFFLTLLLILLTGLTMSNYLGRRIITWLENLVTKIPLLNVIYTSVKKVIEALNVFVPTTPNPTSGMLILVPREDVVFLDMSVEEGLKLIVSGGVICPEYPEKC
jgi:uncharacterized membrane protein